jgi:hypothetical protein
VEAEEIQRVVVLHLVVEAEEIQWVGVHLLAEVVDQDHVEEAIQLLVAMLMIHLFHLNLSQSLR